MIANTNDTFTRPGLQRILCLLSFIIAGVVALAGIAAQGLNSQPSRPSPTPPCVGIATFSNTAPIAIPDSGIAMPYPSDITVAGLPGWPIARTAEVTINGLTHTLTNDVGIVLVGPGGAALAPGSPRPHGRSDVQLARARQRRTGGRPEGAACAWGEDAWSFEGECQEAVRRR